MTPADSSDDRPGDRTPQTEQALRWMQRAGVADELVRQVAARTKRRRRRGGALLIGACAALLLGGFIWHGPEHQPANMATVTASTPPRGLTTTIVSPERLDLPDGSVVELRSGAKISHDYSGAFRRVTLHRGEAHFRAAKNPLRPFVVRAGNVDVRAVGTAFSVQLDATAVEVLVSEGRVAVAKNAETETTASSPLSDAGAPRDLVPVSDAAAVLDAGGHAVIPLADLAPEVTVVAPAQVAQRLAWRVPQLEFSHTPLAEIVQLMNDYNGARRRLVIDGNSGALNDVQLSGLLAADNVEGLVQLIEENFSVRAYYTGDTITLRRAR